MNIEEFIAKYFPYFGKEQLKMIYYRILNNFYYHKDDNKIEVAKSFVYDEYIDTSILRAAYNNDSENITLTYQSHFIDPKIITIHAKEALLHISSYLYNIDAELNNEGYFILKELMKSLIDSEKKQLESFIYGFCEERPKPGDNNRVKFMLTYRNEKDPHYIDYIIWIQYRSFVKDHKSIPIFMVTVIENKEKEKIFNVNNAAINAHEENKINQKWRYFDISYPDLLDLVYNVESEKEYEGTLNKIITETN